MVVRERRRLEGMLQGAGTREGSRRRDLLEHCLACERRGSAESGCEGV